MADSNAGAVIAFVVLVAACGLLIAATAALTGERIEANRAQRFQDTVTALAGSGGLTTDLNWSEDVAHLCNGRALLRGSTSGYGGAIDWLAAADLETTVPTLTGVRITRHQETPGIADFIDTPERGWLGALRGADSGGIARVDTVSGATITSRALRRALSNALTRPALDQEACSP
jgi:Na+-translocating ferredoxin:NAD+ oxidoreductase RnfG subunit